MNTEIVTGASAAATAGKIQFPEMQGKGQLSR
jgi:hypothetical protein